MSFFISMEGFDGTGKSTQSKLLKNGLDKENIDSIIVREPGSTNFSEKIRNIIKENTEIEIMTELLLFQTSRSELVSKENGEIKIINEFLPEQLDEAQTALLCDDAIKATEASTLKEIGKVIKYLKDNSSSALDISLASKLIKEKLGN